METIETKKQEVEIAKYELEAKQYGAKILDYDMYKTRSKDVKMLMFLNGFVWGIAYILIVMVLSLLIKKTL